MSRSQRPHADNGNGRAAAAKAAVAERPALITGGAGFIGSNLADRLLHDGRRVLLLDNLARPGVQRNVDWLVDRHGGRVRLIEADVRDPAAVRRAVGQSAGDRVGASAVGAVFHLAAQVAVTTSFEDPLADFETNARGTLNVLEALRGLADPPPLLFTSTNKVYGDLADVPLRAAGDRYEPADRGPRTAGICERPLAFRSPYGCSKGAADQYVLDYARSFGLPAAVFRMSCVYGPRQFGTEDQGWVAHFMRRAIRGEPITLFGDGRQVRDLLYIDDLTDAMRLAAARLAEQAAMEAGWPLSERAAAMRDRSPLAGRAFNIGGGPAHAVSLIELIERIAEQRGQRPLVSHRPWRPGDQRYYVSDTGRFTHATGWRPTTGIDDGLDRLHAWLTELHEAEHAPQPQPLG